MGRRRGRCRKNRKDAGAALYHFFHLATPRGAIKQPCSLHKGASLPTQSLGVLDKDLIWGTWTLSEHSMLGHSRGGQGGTFVRVVGGGGVEMVRWPTSALALPSGLPASPGGWRCIQGAPAAWQCCRWLGGLGTRSGLRDAGVYGAPLSLSRPLSPNGAARGPHSRRQSAAASHTRVRRGPPRAALRQLGVSLFSTTGAQARPGGPSQQIPPWAGQDTPPISRGSRGPAQAPSRAPRGSARPGCRRS